MADCFAAHLRVLLFHLQQPWWACSSTIWCALLVDSAANSFCMVNHCASIAVATAGGYPWSVAVTTSRVPQRTGRFACAAESSCA
ncbi:MAG: hypothetical protein R2911_44070 [Caldilineaceae bacterium]